MCEPSLHLCEGETTQECNHASHTCRKAIHQQSRPKSKTFSHEISSDSPDLKCFQGGLTRPRSSSFGKRRDLRNYIRRKSNEFDGPVRLTKFERGLENDLRRCEGKIPDVDSPKGIRNKNYENSYTSLSPLSVQNGELNCNCSKSRADKDNSYPNCDNTNLKFDGRIFNRSFSEKLRRKSANGSVARSRSEFTGK